MKIAYLASLYPAVSHTFVLREVLALRARGHDVGTFSIRRPAPHDIKGDAAQREAERTRWLVPGQPASYARAFAWLSGRPERARRALALSQAGGDFSLRERAMASAYYAEAVQLAHWLVPEGFEHLHCHFGNSGSSTAMLAAELTGIPFSITCHGSELNDAAKFRLAQKAAQAAFMVCVSKFGRARLMQITEPDLWSRFEVVRCGVENIQASPLPSHDGPGRIVCVARLSAEKAHLVLLSALAELALRGQAFHCALVGDGPMRATIEARLEALGLSTRVTLTGALSPEQVAAEYERADIVVLASFSEGVPVVLMEAMAHGRPVVATRVGGVAELVVNGQSGYVVAPGDALELADALGTLLSDRGRAAAMGRAGSSAVWQEFSVARSAERLEALFESAGRRP